MDALTSQLDGFIQLGEYLREIHHEQERYSPLFDCLQKAEQVNGWFNQKNCLLALTTWGETLQADNLAQWTAAYQLPNEEPKTIGLILAGNIPLVGFHDVLSVLISGHKVNIKLSSSDPFFDSFSL